MTFCIVFLLKGAVRLGRALLEHAEKLLDRGFRSKDIADGFVKAAEWCVDHVGSELCPNLIMSASQAVKMILKGDEEEEEDVGGLVVGLGAQRNLVEELDQAAVALQQHSGGNPLTEHVSETSLKSLLLLHDLILNAHLNLLTGYIR